MNLVVGLSSEKQIQKGNGSVWVGRRWWEPSPQVRRYSTWLIEEPSLCLGWVCSVKVHNYGLNLMGRKTNVQGRLSQSRDQCLCCTASESESLHNKNIKLSTLQVSRCRITNTNMPLSSTVSLHLESQRRSMTKGCLRGGSAPPRVPVPAAGLRGRPQPRTWAAAEPRWARCDQIRQILWAVFWAGAGSGNWPRCQLTS